MFEFRRYAPYTVKCRNQLKYLSVHDKRAFKNWYEEYIKDSSHSHQDCLPSSQLPKTESVVEPNQRQLFVVIDTCSLVKHQKEFTEYVTALRKEFRGSKCPIKFILTIKVIEELDKCNRKSSRKRPTNQSNLVNQNCVNDNGNPPIDDLLNYPDPPRSFMRIIEEETRTFEILVTDLDPSNQIRLPNDQLCQFNSDNRILQSCLISQHYIESLPHHKDTRVILVTEDNNFKTKATTFQIVSFRWREFLAKYRNFGKRNYVETPRLVSRENTIRHLARTTNSSGLRKSQDDVIFVEEVITVD